MLIPLYIKDIASCFFAYIVSRKESVVRACVCSYVRRPQRQTEHCTAALKMFVTGLLDADPSQASPVFPASPATLSSETIFIPL